MILNRRRCLIFYISSICITTGTYEAWKELNTYEQLEKENLKTPIRKISRSTEAFVTGAFINGIMYSLLMPVLIPGTLISGVHSMYYKSRKAV